MQKGDCSDGGVGGRTFAHKDDARPQARVARGQTDKNTTGTCLFKSGTVGPDRVTM